VVEEVEDPSYSEVIYDEDGKVLYHYWEMEPTDGPEEPIPEGIPVSIRSWYPAWLVAWLVKRSINKHEKKEKRNAS